MQRRRFKIKVKVFAVVTLAAILIGVIINTVVIEKQISEVTESVKELDINAKTAKEAAESIYRDFREKETCISLTVNHDDLTNIEEGFAELIGYLALEDTDGAYVTKNRLLDSLEHLRRLSGFNIDAII